MECGGLGGGVCEGVRVLGRVCVECGGLGGEVCGECEGVWGEWEWSVEY